MKETVFLKRFVIFSKRFVMKASTFALMAKLETEQLAPVHLQLNIGDSSVLILSAGKLQRVIDHFYRVV